MRREDFTDAYGRTEKPEPDVESDFSTFRKKSYDRYFEGYTVENFIGSDGKIKKYRVYTGDLFRPELDDAARGRLKLAYGFCLCASLVLSISALALPVPCNSSVAAFSFGCIPTVLCIRMLFAFGAYAGAGAELKIHEYNAGAKALERFALPALIASAAAAAAGIAVMIIQKNAFTFAELARILMFAASGLLAYAVGMMEKKVKYRFISGSKSS